MPRDLDNVRAVTVKRGNWLGEFKGPEGPKKIPFIDRQGKFTGTHLYTCNLSSQSYLSTVIATISRRLFFWIKRHNKPIKKRKERKYLETITTKVSGLYALTKNDYLLNRILVLFRNIERNRKPIAGLVNSFASKLDVYKGFVYSQACKHAHWLTSRAQRPRDKSSTDLRKYPFPQSGVTTLERRKLFISEAIYATTSVVAQIGSIVYTQLTTFGG